MYKLDEQEKLIVREIIRDTRISDNQISLRTNVPLNTVNRKRKLLEEKGLIHYYCYLDNTIYGTGTIGARGFFVLILRDGITRKAVLEKVGYSEKSKTFFTKHLFVTFVGEAGGNIAIMGILESRKSDDLIEIYNAEIIPEFESYFGHGCIKEIKLFPITSTIRMLRNYFPGKNTKNGVIREDWPNDFIYVDE